MLNKLLLKQSFIFLVLYMFTWCFQYIICFICCSNTQCYMC